jgi:N-acetylneuraminate synthase
MSLSSLYQKWKNSDNSQCYIIAEIGINHNGDLGIAKKLIYMAKQAGCDAVKFQKRDPDVCVPEIQKNVPRDTPWGLMTYLDYKKRIEFGREQYDEIARYCTELRIDWSASAWDLPSLQFLKSYNIPFHKVASAMINNVNFLEQVASEKKVTFISTGMSELSDIDKAVDIFSKFKCPFVLMHTFSQYPAQTQDLNLKIIETLKNRYTNVPIGYSGHETSVMPSAYAVILGAIAVERHITLDRAMFGTDQSASLELRGLTKLVSEIRKIPLLMGDGIKVFGEKEKLVAQKLRPQN